VDQKDATQLADQLESSAVVREIERTSDESEEVPEATVLALHLADWHLHRWLMSLHERERALLAVHDALEPERELRELAEGRHHVAAAQRSRETHEIVVELVAFFIHTRWSCKERAFT
jgi:hypothetical protein